MNSTEKWAKVLDTAAVTAASVQQISLSDSIDLEESYAIQEKSIQHRLERGEKLTGLKMGFTSTAKMEQMGVHDMIWGRLTDSMQIPNQGGVELNRFIHPRAEPELAFRVDKDITSEVSLDRLKNYIGGIGAAIEIIDSRYENFRFSLEDVIADNCSSSGYVIGSWFDVDLDISDLQIDLFLDDNCVHSGSSKAILGDPWKSIQACTRLAAKYGQPIPAGSIILAGAATPASYISVAKKVRASVESLGELCFFVHKS